MNRVRYFAWDWKGMLRFSRSIPFVLLLLFSLAACGQQNIDEVFQLDRTGIADSTWKMIELSQDQLKKDNHNVKAMFGLASAYLQAVRENADVSLYTKIDQLMGAIRVQDPKNDEVDFFLAQVDLGRHQFVEALKKGVKLTDAAPEVARYYGVLADAQIELGKYEDALDSLQTMIDLKPDFSSYSRIAYIREIFGDREGAIEMMELATEAAGSIPENAAWSYSELGRLWMGINPELARKSYNNALALYPDFGFALEGLAKLEAFEGNLDQALVMIQKAFDLSPLPQYASTMAEIYQLQGNQEKADLYFRLVEVGFDQIALAGTDVTLERAEFLVRHKRHPVRALEVARQAYEERPTIFAADTLAWAYYQNSQLDKAVELIKKALETDSQDARLLFHAGAIAAEQGDREDAERMLEKALRLNPRFSLLEVKQLQDVLKSMEIEKQ